MTDANNKNVFQLPKNPGCQNSDTPELIKNIANPQVQRDDYTKVRRLLSNMDDVEKNVLRCATLLPKDGLDMELLQSCVGDDWQETVFSLIDRGWLAKRNKNLLTIPPMFRLMCREELNPSEECCIEFLDALWGQLGRDEYDRVKFAQMAEVFANAMEIDGSPWTKAEWLNNSGRLWGDLMESRKAAALYERYIPELEQQIPTTPALATAYNNVGSTYGDLGDHHKALEYKLKALEICKKVLPQEHPSLATSYNNVGMTYGALGDHHKALEYQLKALAIREKVLPLEHPSLATSYNNVGSTYGALGDFRKALEYKLKDLAICEKVLPSEHPDLATSYNNIGLTYGDLGNHSKALEYKLKALEIREKVLPPEHPSLAISYNNVGSTYGALGDHQKEMEYDLKALEIREKVLPPEHPDLAQSYNNIGITYANLKQFAKAVEYLEKALEILKKSLPGTHPYIAQTEQSLEGIRFMAMLQEAGISLDDLMKGNGT